MKTTLLLIVSFIFLVMTACNSEKKESKIQTKDALENIMGRKSVRKYLPKPVEKEKIEVLLKAGMAAPSGKDVLGIDRHRRPGSARFYGCCVALCQNVERSSDGYRRLWGYY